MKFRIDVQDRNGHWVTDGPIYHEQTPLAALEDFATQAHTALKRPVRIVKVHEIHQEYVETVKTFDGEQQQAVTS